MDLSISMATMLMQRIQMGQSRMSVSAVTPFLFEHKFESPAKMGPKSEHSLPECDDADALCLELAPVGVGPLELAAHVLLELLHVEHLKQKKKHI